MQFAQSNAGASTFWVRILRAAAEGDSRKQMIGETLVLRTAEDGFLGHN